jgi:hypothetical protein
MAFHDVVLASFTRTTAAPGSAFVAHFSVAQRAIGSRTTGTCCNRDTLSDLFEESVPFEREPHHLTGALVVSGAGVLCIIPGFRRRGGGKIAPLVRVSKGPAERRHLDAQPASRLLHGLSIDRSQCSPGLCQLEGVAPDAGYTWLEDRIDVVGRDRA